MTYPTNNKLTVFLSSPMPTEPIAWNHLRDTIDYVFKASPLSILFDLNLIEDSGGTTPEPIYVKAVQKSDIILAILGNKIPKGQKRELEEAKKNKKVTFAISLEYPPFNNSIQDGADLNILYDITTVQHARTSKDLFNMIQKQLFGFITQFFDKISPIHPKEIEEKLSRAIEHDDDDSLFEIGQLMEKIGVEDDNVYLMSYIYCIFSFYGEKNFSSETLREERIYFLAKHNQTAWNVLLATAFAFCDDELFTAALESTPTEYSKITIQLIYDVLKGIKPLELILDDGHFQKHVEDLCCREFYSIQIFERSLYKIADEI